MGGVGLCKTVEYTAMSENACSLHCCTLKVVNEDSCGRAGLWQCG